jgi:hypothetical protein
MQPIDYSIDVQTPFQSALQGYQAGAAIRDDQLQQQQRAALALRQEQMQRDLAALEVNPNAGARAYAAFTLKYPELTNQFKQAWEMSSEEQRKGALDLTTRAYAALSTGRPDVAEQLMRDRAAAMRNSGAPEEEAAAQEMWANLIKESPDHARHFGSLMLASVMGDKFADTFGKLGDQGRAADKAPAELSKAQADAAAAASDAETKRVQAKYADSQAVLDLQKKGWDIKKIESDIDVNRQNARIAAINAAISREGNDLKREELRLKLEEARAARDAKVRENVGKAETGASAIDNALNTIERIKRNPSLDDVIGPLEGSMPRGLNPLSGENADAVALIETLSSQTFLSQIPAMKGTGNLTEKEGEKLEKSLQSLNRAQSEKQFRANLDEAARLLTKARAGLSRSTGVPLAPPDTPAAPGARPPLSSFGKP